MGKDLKGKVVVVTGASKGIGFAVAKAFAKQGANVVMLARGKERLDQAANEVGELGFPVPTDLANPDSVRAAFDFVEKKFGKLDVLANVAGMAHLARIEEATDAQIMESFGTNLFGVIYTTRSAIPLIRKAGTGDIINFSSESTMFPFPFLGLYATSKAAVEMFCVASAKELRPEGIRVTNLVCGATDSEFSVGWDMDQAMRFIQAASASGDLQNAGADKQMDPNDVADAVVFVATRPDGQIIDKIHVRSYATGDGSAAVEKQRQIQENK